MAKSHVQRLGHLIGQEFRFSIYDEDFRAHCDDHYKGIAESDYKAGGRSRKDIADDIFYGVGAEHGAAIALGGRIASWNDGRTYAPDVIDALGVRYECKRQPFELFRWYNNAAAHRRLDWLLRAADEKKVDVLVTADTWLDQTEMVTKIKMIANARTIRNYLGQESNAVFYQSDNACRDGQAFHYLVERVKEDA